MAVNVTSQQHTIDANDTFIIKYGQLSRRPETLIIDFDDTSDDGTYTIAARPQGSSVAFRQIPYQSLHLNGAVGTGALISDNITGDSLIAVEADGLEVAIVRAGGSTGSTVVTLAFASLAS